MVRGNLLELKRDAWVPFERLQNVDGRRVLNLDLRLCHRRHNLLRRFKRLVRTRVWLACPLHVPHFDRLPFHVCVRLNRRRIAVKTLRPTRPNARGRLKPPVPNGRHHRRRTLLYTTRRLNSDSDDGYECDPR